MKLDSWEIEKKSKKYEKLFVLSPEEQQQQQNEQVLVGDKELSSLFMLLA